jgi:hypothetical protein
MRWSCDRTGYPLLELPELGLACGLWPVARVQAERWLAEPNGPGDAWYEELLAVHERASWRQPDLTDYEGLFLTAVRPDEALAFAGWLGEGFDLPGLDTWRLLAQLLLAAPLTPEAFNGIAGDNRLHAAARGTLLALWHHARPTTWGELALLRGGLLEWVRGGPAQPFGGLGEPRPRFHRIIFNPQRDAPTRPPGGARSRCFGARLVRPLAPPEASRP